MAFWNKDREVELLKHWQSGLSASLIATRMGAPSRNSILGKVWRMGLEQRRSGGASTDIAKRTAIRRKVRVAPVVPPKRSRHPKRITDLFPVEAPIPPDQYDVARISFSELEDKHCRWICTPTALGPFDKQFCGCERHPGSPYCAEHARRSMGRFGPEEKPWVSWNKSRVVAHVTSGSINPLALEDA